VLAAGNPFQKLPRDRDILLLTHHPSPSGHSKWRPRASELLSDIVTLVINIAAERRHSIAEVAGPRD
jgi:hypothetical protein